MINFKDYPHDPKTDSYQYNSETYSATITRHTHENGWPSELWYIESEDDHDVGFLRGPEVNEILEIKTNKVTNTIISLREDIKTLPPLGTLRAVVALCEWDKGKSQYVLQFWTKRNLRMGWANNPDGKTKSAFVAYF